MKNNAGPIRKSGYFYGLIAIIWLLSIPSLAFAEILIFEKDYVYQAGEADSKISCRTIAIEQVKRQLLEELGTYLESETEVKDFQLTKDKIIVLTAGIVKVDILDEQWDGATYRLRAKIAADPEEVARSIDQLRQDRQKMKELEEARQRADELLVEVEKLKKELDLAKADSIQKEQREYTQTIKELSSIDWFDRGYASTFSGDYDNAIDSFSKSAEINPAFAAAYNNRGIVYAATGNYQQAISDFNRVIIINPGYAPAYYQRGIVYFNLGNHKQAIKDYDKAIKIDSKYTNAYYHRGTARIYTNDNKRAMKDFNKAIELNPANQDAYRDRGAVYTRLGKRDEAIKDYNKAAELGNRKIGVEPVRKYIIHGTNASRDAQPGIDSRNTGTPNNRQTSAPAGPPRNIDQRSQSAGPQHSNHVSSPNITSAPSTGRSTGYSGGSTRSTPVGRSGHSGSGSGRTGSSSRGGRR